MAGMGSLRVCNICLNLQRYGSLRSIISPVTCTVIPVRHKTNKHYDPKWKRQRGLKFLKMDLPDYDRSRREAGMSMDEVRAKMKRDGVEPPRHGKQERNINLGSTGGVDSPYKPPEGDGIASSVERAKETAIDFGRKGKSYLHIKKIRNFEKYDNDTFAAEALEIYKQAHECLQDIKNNEDELHDLVTERAYPEMVWQLEKKTFRWKYHETLEPPKVVQVRTLEVMSKENMFAQITVRLHTSQLMAIYDRFGRLQYGNENVIKDILEYVVFEKHITEMYSKWRIHAKIVPEWMPSRTEVLRTMRKPEQQKPEEKKELTEVSTTEELPSEPRLATA